MASPELRTPHWAVELSMASPERRNYGRGTPHWAAELSMVSPELRDDELIGQGTAATVASAQGLNITSGAKPATRKLQVISRDSATELLADVQRVADRGRSGARRPVLYGAQPRADDQAVLGGVEGCYHRVTAINSAGTVR